MPERRSLATAVLFCILCGMTLAAIGVSVATAYDAIGGAALAAAVALIGLVQLSILIGNWRRSAPYEAAEPAHVPRVDARSASELIRQDRAGDHWRTREPDTASMPMARASADAASAAPEVARPAQSVPIFSTRVNSIFIWSRLSNWPGPAPSIIAPALPSRATTAAASGPPFFRSAPGRAASPRLSIWRCSGASAR
jgi:hypothetical protein